MPLVADHLTVWQTPYIWKRRADGLYVINLAKTWEKLMLAARVIVAIENPQDGETCAQFSPVDELRRHQDSPVRGAAGGKRFWIRRDPLLDRCWIGRRGDVDPWQGSRGDLGFVFHGLLAHVYSETLVRATFET